jgi:uncharacterized membrane protein YeaQ/YmgE (transglycosylase-associated protein family)
MVSVLTGLVGGIVATVVMTAFMMALGGDDPPPTAQLWSQYLGDKPATEYMMQGMLLHVLYGTIAGVVYAVVVDPLAVGFSPEALTGGLVFGVVYGVVLFVVAAAFWMNVVLDMDPEPKDVGLFLFFHFVYGAVLGAWTATAPLGL